MATIDVLPSALVSAAAAVRCFSAELDPVVLRSDVLRSDALRSDVLSEAVAVFSSRWSQALDALTADADAAAAALRDAAIGYAELDSLLVPRSLR